MLSPNELSRRFNYHAPDEVARRQHQAVRDLCKELAIQFNELPIGREQSLAITKIEEAMFWANAAIARSKA